MEAAASTAAGVIPLTLVEQAKADQAPAGPPGARPAEPVNWTTEGRELVEFTLTLLVPLSPSLETVYPPEVRARLAEHIGAVLKKYDVTIAVLFGKWAPELGLVICAAPLIAPTVAAIRTDRAAKAAAGEQPAAPPAGQPAGAPAAPPAEKPTAPPDLTRFPGISAETKAATVKPAA